MSDDTSLPLVLDFVPRNDMRKVALVCRFFMTQLASLLEPSFCLFFVVIIRMDVTSLISRLSCPIQGQSRDAMSQIRYSREM